MQQVVYNNSQENSDDELNINLKKLFIIIWNRKNIIIKVFILILMFFVMLTFILPKTYKVETDLYINNSNNTNITEINPYIINETGNNLISLSSDKGMVNELEIMQSPLVIDKVIRENNLVYKKKFGFIPNKKEGEFISTKAFLKKNINFESKKNTNIISIEYKSQKPDLAYNVVSSIITNYIELHKELNSYKSKSDKKIIESEYNRAKADLNKKINSASGLPSNAINGAGSLAALSAFSTSAQKAMGTIQGHYLASEKSRVEITEDAQTVANLSQKLEWAKLVEDMSDTSKVLVLKEPKKLRDFEYSSPKLAINIILGIIFGLIGSLIALIVAETNSKKLTYGCLGDEIIYNLERDYIDLQVCLLANQEKQISFIMFDNIPQSIMEKLLGFKNIKFVKAEISSDFVAQIMSMSDAILVAKINATDTKLYKQIKSILKDLNKNIVKEVLV